MGVKKSTYFMPDTGKDYIYRADSSMIPSAEWLVGFDDFDQSWFPTTAITNGHLRERGLNLFFCIIVYHGYALE